MSDELNAEQWNIVKGLVGVVELNTQQIRTLFRLHWELVAMARRACGLPDDPEPAPQVMDAESTARMTVGLAELERMFAERREDQDKGDPEKGGKL